MKKCNVFFLFLLLTTAVSAQPLFDAGIKAGINNSKVTVNLSDYSTESIVKSHIGAFARIGWGRIYIQPEAYFSSKGGELENPTVLDMLTKFDFGNLDVPLLLGAKVVDGENANVRIMAGPVFSFLTSSDVEGDDLISPDYYKNNYYGYQYGLGFDIGSLFIDARMEHGANRLYYHPDLELNGKNKTFMVTVGFKIF
jgi:hypothetical protein